MKELTTTKKLLKSTLPKQIWKGEGYTLKPLIKKLTNYKILDNIIYKLQRKKLKYIIVWDDDYIKISSGNKSFKVRMYEVKCEYTKS